MVICLERGADLHMAQLMPLPLTVPCSSKIQTGFTFLLPAHPGGPGQGPLNGCVCVLQGVAPVGQKMSKLPLPPTDLNFICGWKRGSWCDSL